MGNKLSKKKKGNNQMQNANDIQSQQSKPPTVLTKPFKCTSVSIYDDRLRLLIAGYFKEITDSTHSNDAAPDDIVNECAFWLKIKLEIIYSKYYYEATSIPLEIHLDGFVLNILNYKHIEKYQINYIEYIADDSDTFGDRFWDSHFDINKYAKEHESRMEHVFITNIFEPKCLAFTQKMDIDLGNVSNALVQILPIDHDDNIIDISQWKKMNANVSSVSDCAENYNDDAIEKYWRDNVAIKNKLTATINEWIVALKKNQIETDEFLCKKLFYFILFNNGSNKHVMDVKDLKYFICDDECDEYSNDYNGCIWAFRKQIPNFSD